MDDVIVAKPEMSPKKRAMIFSGVVVVGSIAGLITVGGHPRSNWFYPFVLLIAVLSSVRILRRGDRPLTEADDPPKPMDAALISAAIAFVLSGLVLYGWVNLLWPEGWSWAVAIFLSATNAANVFRQRRGYVYSGWPTFILFIGFIVALLIFKNQKI